MLLLNIIHLNLLNCIIPSPQIEINMELKLDRGPRLSLIRTRVLLKIIGTFDQLGGSQQLGVLGLHPEQGGQYRRVSDSLH